MKRPMIAFVFLTGMVAGALAQRVCFHLWRPHPPKPDEMAARMAKDLGLDDAQGAQLAEIFREEDPKMRAIHQSVQDQFDAQRKEMDVRIAAILRPEQKTRFEALQERWKEHEPKDDGRMMPPPPR